MVFRHMAGFAEFTGRAVDRGGGGPKDVTKVTKVNLLKKNMRVGTSKTHFTVKILYFRKGDSEI